MWFFDLDGDAADRPALVFDDRLADPRARVRQGERLAFEKEMLGLYVSDHPLMGAERGAAPPVECTIAELADLEDGAMRTVAGVVTA